MSPRTLDRRCVLTINGGSSSLKFALFDLDDLNRRRMEGRVERIGREGSRRVVQLENGERAEREVEAPDQGAAARIVLDEIEKAVGLGPVAVVGHRIVYGGDRYTAPGLVDTAMLDELRRLSPLDPEHLPGEIALLEALGEALPGVPQVGCFDTAFHRTLPTLARIVPIPRRYASLGVRRYGFHGLSYEYLMNMLARTAPPEEARGRVILAHLGAGASMAAVRGGACLETTMGFTPTSGLVMGTRSGDVDPALGPFLARVEGMTPERFDHMVNKESGLLGVSETSPDIRDLLVRRDHDHRAAEAIGLFCYTIKKTIGALAAVLGGLDALVFSGGIGENSAEVRREACEGLAFLGINLDDRRNAEGAPLISTEGSRVALRVIRTDEESVIARSAIRVGLPGESLPRSHV